MYYLKGTDFTGIFELPTTVFQSNIESRIEQLERSNINYVIGNDLGSLFYADLDIAGNPTTPRFIQLSPYIKDAVLRFTYVEVFTYLRSLNSAIGVSSVANELLTRYPMQELALIHDDGVSYALSARKYICNNSLLYPEYCSCCVSPLRRYVL